jgi:hypothetical protein
MAVRLPALKGILPPGLTPRKFPAKSGQIKKIKFKNYGAGLSKFSCAAFEAKFRLHTGLGMQINSGHKYYEE